MNWIPITTKTRTAPEFIGSEPIHRATWLCLMLHCAEHETGGTIRDCASWGDRRWMQTVGVTKAEIRLETPLYFFRGADLVVWGYDPKYEDVIRAKREGGRIGGKLSAASRSAPSAEVPTKESLKESSNGKDRIGSDRIGFKPSDGGQTGKSSGWNPGDKYERIHAVPQAKLAQWAAEFCGDEPSWIRVYNAYIAQIGPEAFRAILAQFVGEVGAGEDGKRRGAVLVAKVKKAIAEKRKAVAT